MTTVEGGARLRPQDTADRAKHDLQAFVNRARAEGEEEPEVWVRNTSSARISMHLDSESGSIELPLLPVSPAPYLLSGEVDLSTLTKSRKFRALLRQRFRDSFNPEHADNGKFVCELMTGTEAREYYIRAAQLRGLPSWEAAWAQAEESVKRGAAQVNEHFTERNGFAPPRSAQELAGRDLARRGITADTSRLAGALSSDQAQALLDEEEKMQERLGLDGRVGGQLYVEEPVNARVIQLCHEASAQVDTGLRMPAAQFITTLVEMEHALTEADFDYIQAHGTYKPVKQWAGRMRAERFAAAEPELSQELTDQLEGKLPEAVRLADPVDHITDIPEELLEKIQPADAHDAIAATAAAPAAPATDARDAELSELRSMVLETQRMLAQALARPHPAPAPAAEAPAEAPDGAYVTTEGATLSTTSERVST
jgi:hypothetical protein